MPLGVSIVICCHNSAERIPETLRFLADQRGDDSYAWEVIVVDNASSDKTSIVAEKSCPEALRGRLRIVSEPMPGLTHARLCGVRKSQYEIVSFIDDDNWVCEDWVQQISNIFSNKPKIGAAGGPSEAMFEESPPVWFRDVQGFFAVGPQHSQTGDVTDAAGSLLWGAGLSLRKKAIQELLSADFQFLLSDRKGAQLTTGGDTEMCFALRALGWRFWYDEQLLLRHYVPAGRLSWEYACKLLSGMGEASALFNIYLIALQMYPFTARVPRYKMTWLFQFLKGVKSLLTLIFKYPIECLLQREGDRNKLTFHACTGYLNAMVRARSEYHSKIREIRAAKWNYQAKRKAF